MLSTFKQDKRRIGVSSLDGMKSMKDIRRRKNNFKIT